MALPYCWSYTSCARLTDVILCFISFNYRITSITILGNAAYTPPTCEVPKGQKGRVRNSRRNLGAEGGQDTRPLGTSQHRRDGPGGPSPALEAKERSKVPDVCATFYLLFPRSFPARPSPIIKFMGFRSPHTQGNVMARAYLVMIFSLVPWQGGLLVRAVVTCSPIFSQILGPRALHYKPDVPRIHRSIPIIHHN